MLIVGLGNPDRGDDAAGILVARGLVEQGIKALEYQGAPIDLIEIWEPAGSVVIVDAIVSGAGPGTFRVWDAQTTEFQSGVFRSSSHEFGLAETIELARALKRLPKELRVYGIEAAQFDAGAPLSPHVLAGVNRALEQIVADLYLSNKNLR